MARGDRFTLQPSLCPRQWRKYSWNALRHRSGKIVVFCGPDPDQARRACLKKLNQMKPLEKIRVEHIDQL